MKCCLCNKKIEAKGTWTQGHNAQPLAKGRCCALCNAIKVIPYRLDRIFNTERRKDA